MAETRDLGATDGPMLIFGGPYGNLQATQALLAAAAALGIPATRILCTGDVAAYCADPEATVELVRDANIALVMGNCEESLGTDAESCGCGFDKGTSVAAGMVGTIETPGSSRFGTGLDAAKCSHVVNSLWLVGGEMVERGVRGSKRSVHPLTQTRAKLF